jgi:hypothetical protein
MADETKVKVEVPPGPLGADAQVKPAEEMTKAELKEVLVNPDDAKLHPAPGSDAIESEFGAQTESERPPFATGRPDVPILSGLAAGPGAHTPPDPDEFDAMGRPINPRPSEGKK